jgi:L-threonylcarbamoyladenylate synthase
MKIVDVDDLYAIPDTLKVLRDCGVVVIPTDTVYGLACDSGCRGARDKITLLKKRDNPGQRIPWLVSDIDMALKYVHIDPQLVTSLSGVWPGALTGVFRTLDGESTLGIRIPNHPFVIELISDLERPLKASSVNITGSDPVSNADEIARDFHADLIIDGGEVSDNIASTVVDFTTAPYSILREGAISKDTLEEVFKLQFDAR